MNEDLPVSVVEEESEKTSFPIINKIFSLISFFFTLISVISILIAIGIQGLGFLFLSILLIAVSVEISLVNLFYGIHSKRIFQIVSYLNFIVSVSSAVIITIFATASNNEALKIRPIFLLFVLVSVPIGIFYIPQKVISFVKDRVKL